MTHDSGWHRQGDRQDPDPPIVRKVPADSVPYGDSISRNGRSVWGAWTQAGELIVVAATAKEARIRFRKGRVAMRVKASQEKERLRNGSVNT